MQHNTEWFLWIESMPLEVIGGVMGFLHTFLQLQISKWSTPLCKKVPCRSDRWSQRASNHFQISTVFFLWTTPTKIPCPIDIWILYVALLSKVSGFTRFFTHCSSAKLLRTGLFVQRVSWFQKLPGRIGHQWTSSNGQAIRCSWHQKCGKLPPTILFFNRFRHNSTRQRCRGTLKSPMKKPPDSSCWQINWISGNLSLTDARARRTI